jgi:hypothetical protein
MRCNLGWDYSLYSECFLEEGKSGKSKECLEKAIDIFKSCGAEGWVKRKEEQLSAI